MQFNIYLILGFGFLGLLIHGILHYVRHLKQDTHGSASWMSKWQRKELLNQKNDGLVIDGINRLTKTDSFENLLLVAPTGQGKSTGFVIPNVILSDGNSSVIVDPSGEIYDMTAAGMQKMGYQIILISPVRKPSNCYNPLHYVSSLKDSGMVSESLMAHLESKSSPIWHTAGAKLLQSIIYFLVLKSAEDDINYRTINNLIDILGKDYDEQERILGSVKDEKLTFIYSSFKNANKEAKAGIQLMAKEAVGLFIEDEMAELTGSHNISFHDLREKKTIIYLIFPEMEIKHYSPFLKIFFSQLFHFINTNPDGLAVFCLLEEAGNIGKIPLFEKAITTLRKRKFSISVVLQEIRQLENVYGRESAEVILSGGTVSKLFLPGLGRTACREISEMLGDETIKSQSKSKSRREDLSDKSVSIEKNKS